MHHPIYLLTVVLVLVVAGGVEVVALLEVAFVGRLGAVTVEFEFEFECEVTVALERVEALTVALG